MNLVEFIRRLTLAGKWAIYAIGVLMAVIVYTDAAPYATNPVKPFGWALVTFGGFLCAGKLLEWILLGLIAPSQSRP